MDGWLIPPPSPPVKSDQDLRREREEKVAELKRRGLLRSERLRVAMLTVRREDFIPAAYRDHAYEFTRLVMRLDGEAADEYVRNLVADNYSIHFHVWTHESFMRFLLDVRDRYAIPFTLEANVLNRPRDETVVILRKRDPDREAIEP